MGSTTGDGGSLPDRIEPPAAASRWYPRGKWVVLHSVEGRDDWDSDALDAAAQNVPSRCS